MKISRGKHTLMRFQREYQQACRFFVLRRVSRTIPSNTRETMYKALIALYFDFSSCVWGYIGKGLLEKLQQLQNRAARIVSLSNYETRSKYLLDELGWEVRKVRQLAILM